MGSAGITRSFTPKRQDQTYIFSAWVKKPANFNNGAGNAAWTIAVAGGATGTLNFPDTVGSWTYVYQLINLPGAQGSAAIQISCENMNTTSNVLVDDLRISPLGSPFQAYVHDLLFRQPNALLGANGESRRAVHDLFQQPILATNPADRTAKIQRGFFSRNGHQGTFDTADPNHTLTIGAAGGGALTQFTRGSEWQAVWQPQANTWQVDGDVLTQTAAGLPGRLTSIDDSLGSSYALDVQFDVSEALTSALGIQLGTGITLQWLPQSTQWQLLDGSQKNLAPPVDVPAFAVPSTPYASELQAGTISDALQAAFGAAGYLLPADSTVSSGVATPTGWTLTAPNNAFRFALRQDGAQIQVYATNTSWTLVVGPQSVAFWADGQLIFSYAAPQKIVATPSLFFGNRVAISSITTAVAPQAAVKFDDSRGLTIQSQQYATDRVIVAQAIADDMGRLSVRSKSAFVTSAQNPLFAYCQNFAKMNWTTGTVSGLLNDAYPADQGYPFARQLFDPSPLARVVEEGIPGSLFAVGAHSTRYGYSAVTRGAATYANKTTTGPNGSVSAEVTTLLGQVICRTSQGNGTGVHNETVYDDAGNAAELRSPNYFAPPANSSPTDWVTKQTFDYGNRLLTVTTGSQAPLRFIYDRSGNVRFTQDGQGARPGPITTRSMTATPVSSNPAM